jgi:hypothetical protein
LLAALETCSGVRSASGSLGVPVRDFEFAAEELLAWDLLTGSPASLNLTQRGMRCVDVWRDTGKTGYWSFPTDSSWILGNGSFFFRKPLASLDEAGLNPETGESLSEGEAEALLAEYRFNAQTLARQLESRSLYHHLREVLEMGEDAGTLFDSAFENVQTRRQSTLLHQQAEEAFAEFGSGGRASWMMKSATKRALSHARNRAWRKICEHEEEAETVARVLLARWLRQKGGCLREIAEEQPNLLTLYTEGYECRQTLEGLPRAGNSRSPLPRCA